MSAFSYPTLDEKLDPRHSALLIIGVQNDFCDADGFFAKSGVAAGGDLRFIREMRKPLLNLIEAARAADCLRVFVRGIYDPIYCASPFAEKLAESNGAYGRACLRGTWGADYWEPFRPQRSAREVEVLMHRNSGFFGTDLAVILRANGIHTAVVTGVLTSVAVDSTSRDAMFEDIFAVVPADTTADYVEDRYRIHLAKIGSGCATISISNDVMRHWRKLPL